MKLHQAAIRAWNLRAQGRLPEAIAAFEAATRRRPHGAQAWRGLASAYVTLGRVPAAIAALRKARELLPDDPDVRSQLLYALNHDCLDAQTIRREHFDWGVQFAARGRRFRRGPGDGSGGRIRVGYVSPNLCQSAVSCFLEPLLTAHDRDNFEIYCYYTESRRDRITERMEAAADAWRDVPQVTTRRVRETILRDRLDILVDLAGHYSRHLALFASRAAPVQIAYLGYPNTTGLRQMDYRITDHVTDPSGAADELYSETLLRLPRCFLAFRPHDPPVAVLPLPSLGPGKVERPFCFGSFCRPAKLSDQVVQTWASILRAVPDSRLLLQHHAVRPAHESAYAAIRTQLRRRFSRHGVSGKRVTFVGELASKEHFELYHQVDLCLDPFPYNGTTAICEALWMGVPSVALTGDSCVSRTATSLLHSVGLKEFTVNSLEDYIAKAVSLTRERPRLARLRAHLRERLQRSELMDGTGLARAIEDQYRLVLEIERGRWKPGGILPATPPAHA